MTFEISPKKLAFMETMAKLEKILPDDWEEAIKYCENSFWSLKEVVQYAAMTGKIPPMKVQHQDPKKVLCLTTQTWSPL